MAQSAQKPGRNFTRFLGSGEVDSSRPSSSELPLQELPPGGHCSRMQRAVGA